MERKNGANALCALLHQLFVQKPSLLKYAVNAFDLFGNRLCNMFDRLWDILEGTARDEDAGEIVCILDALDECVESSRNDLIKLLGRFYRNRDLEDARIRFL